MFVRIKMIMLSYPFLKTVLSFMSKQLLNQKIKQIYLKEIGVVLQYL